MSDYLQIAKRLLELFRGRPDYVAVANDAGFAPQKLDRGELPAEWLKARHLDGKRCLGFYLMNQESCVYCSCVDFDNKPDHPDPDWKAKAEAVYLWLQGMELSPAVELSQSGEAAHVWLFFDKPTPAWMVRKFWSIVSEQCQIPFAEIYPRQDFLSGKGMGNLVRYPLWNKSRFVDPEDEWKEQATLDFLTRIKHVSAWELKDIAFRLGYELKPEPVANGHAIVESGAATNEQPSTEPELSPRVLDRLKRTKSLLSRRWNRDTTGLKDPSRSGLLLSIACELVRQFVPTGEIVQALKVWGREHDFEKVNRSDWIERTISKAYEFTFSKVEEASANMVQMKDACLAYIETLASGGLTHIRSGLKELDKSIDGVAPGEMAIVAARPSHGKSAFVLQWLDRAAADGITSLIISEEMSMLELGKRALHSISHIHFDHWGRNTVAALRQHVDEHYAEKASVYLIENVATIDRAEDVIDQMCSLHGVRLVAVDYVQLLSSRGSNRNEEVSAISRRLKQAAKRNGCGLIAVSQLNREIDKRDFHEPRLSDLRDSGQVEQDADLILFLQWPWKYDDTKPQNEYFIYCAKRRNGPIRESKIQTIFTPAKQIIGSYYEMPKDFVDEMPDSEPAPF